MTDTIRLETLSGEPHLVKTVPLQVPHTDHHEAWNGRYVIPAGTSIGLDGGYRKSIGRAWNTRIEERNRLQADVFLNLAKISEAQKTSFSNDDFRLVPMAFGEQGVPSHFEIEFLTNARRQHMQNNCSSNLTVTEKQEKEPEPLIVQSLEETLKRLRSPAEQIEQAKSPDHVEESDSVGDVLSKLNKPSSSLEDLFKKQLAGNSGEPEPLRVKSLEEAFREKRAQEQASSTSTEHKPASTAMEPLKAPVPFPEKSGR